LSGLAGLLTVMVVIHLHDRALRIAAWCVFAVIVSSVNVIRRRITRPRA